MSDSFISLPDLRRAAIAGHGAPQQASESMRALEGVVDVLQLPTRWLAPLTDRVERLSLVDDVATAARIASLTVWAANQIVIDRARELGDALAAAGIRAVALKGIGLIDAYPSAAHRPLGDVDILVAAADLDRASDVLRAHQHPIAHELAPYLLRQRHAVIATGPDHVVVDLHWRASGWLPVESPSRGGAQPWPLTRAVAAPTGHPLHGSGLLVLTPEDNLAVVAVHGCRPNNDAAVHLAADAHRIISASPTLDGGAVLSSLAEVGHRGRGLRWIQQVASDFGTELPDALRAAPRLSAAERMGARLERFATAASRRSASSLLRLGLSVLAASLAVTLRRPWLLPAHVVGRVRWERSAARRAAKQAAGLGDDE